MLPKDLTKELKDRLHTIKGQVEGVIKMLNESDDPAQILNQFKAVSTGFDKAQHLLLDEVFRKTLAIKIADALENCPGDCGQEEKIAVIRKQFPNLTLYELTDKMKEIENISEFLQKRKSEETTKETALIIDNIVCQGCIEKVTGILKEADGVQEVRAKVMKKLVQVAFNPEKTNEEKLRALLTKAGYKPRET